MATRSRTVIGITLIAALLIWIWGLAGLLIWVRWNSVERPGPLTRELFPYGELRIGVDASYPPFALALDNDLSGLDIDIGKALGNALKVPFRFINMGYDGLYDSLKADQVDILISALPIDYSRSGDVLYTIPYFNAGQVLVTNTASSITSMNTLSDHSLSFEFGSDANLLARLWLRRIAPFQLMPYETPTSALDAVRLNLSDAALVDATSAKLYLRLHHDWQAQQIQATDVLYAIAVSTKRGDTWRAINDVLKSLIDNRTIEDIIKRWL
jgi:glutamine transport system substrate-binding protein